MASKKQGIELSTSLNLLAKTSIFVLILAILAKLFMYAYRIIIARYFGTEVYGLFSLGLMITGFLVIFSTIGLTQGISRYVAFYRGKNEEEKANLLVRTVFVRLLILSLIVGIALFFLSNFIAIQIFHDARLADYLKIFSFAVPITVLMNLLLSVLQGFEKISWYSFILNFLQNFVKIIILGLLIYLGFNASATVLSHVAAISVSLITAYLVSVWAIPKLFKKQKLKNATLKKNLFSEVFSYSWPLLFFGLIESVLYWIDSFMIGYFGSVAEVGLYNAATPLALAFGLTADIFMQLFYPLITREYGRGNIKLIGELSKQVTKWVFVLNLPFLILAIVFPDAILNILFGSEFISAGNALRILCIGTFFSSIAVISNRLIVMKGKSKLILKDIIFATVLNTVLNIIFVPKYGINGAAFSTSTSLIALSVIFVYQSYKELNIVPFRRKMVTVLLAGLASAIVMVLARGLFEKIGLIEVIISFGIFALVYLLLILVSRSLDQNDKAVIGSLKKMSLDKIESIYRG